MDDHHRCWEGSKSTASAIEAVFGSQSRKCTTGINHLRSRRRARQSREIAIRVICYNIEVVARSQVKDGRLTYESLRLDFTLMAGFRLDFTVSDRL